MKVFNFIYKSNFKLNIISRVIIISCQILYVKLYATNLSAEQLGLYFFYTTVSYSITSLVFVPLDYYQQASFKKMIVRYGSIWSIVDLNKRLFKGYLFISVIIILIAYIFFVDLIKYILIILTLPVLLYLNQSFRNYFNNNDLMNYVSVSNIIESTFKVGLFYIATINGIKNIIMLLLSWLFALLISFSYLFFSSLKLNVFIKKNIKKITIKQVLKYCYPLSIGAILNWGQVQGYRLILVPLGYAEEVGIFSTVSNIGNVGMNAVSQIYSQQFTSSIYRTNGKSLGKYLSGGILVITIVAIIGYLFGEYLVAHLTSAIFFSHWKIILYGIFIDGFNLLIGSLVIYITIIDKSKKFIIPSILSMIGMIISILILMGSGLMVISTIGIPLIAAQLTMFIYLLWIYGNDK